MNQTYDMIDAEQIERKTTSPSITVGTTPEIVGADVLHETIDEVAEGFSVGGFKCVHEKCGLVHNHDTTKHRASDTFDMSDEEAASMEANPNCHCGLGELARRGVSGAPDVDRAESMAPIPDSMARHLDAQF